MKAKITGWTRWAAGAVLIAGAAPALAQPAHPGESTRAAFGIGLGAAVGAAVGGPPGLFIGAFGGHLLGSNVELDRRWHRQRDQAGELREQLAAERRARAAVAERLAAAKARPVRTVTLASGPDPARVIADGFAVTLRFRTGSAQVEEHLQRQLARLAKAVAELPRLGVRLDGYADPRGDRRNNRELSRARVEAVRAVLQGAGVAPGRIAAAAHGESARLYTDRDGESLGFERRVVITFVAGEASS